ncbi:MAG: hypothetical protein VXW43_19880, partial [Pseudomonadota bacterium]|nr:hypothetical protein [Pseudomonadota bacterium]
MLFPPRGFRWCAEKFDGDAGDTAIARCLVEYGVLAEDTRDAALRERFHPFNPETEFYSMLIDKNHW